MDCRLTRLKTRRSLAVVFMLGLVVHPPDGNTHHLRAEQIAAAAANTAGSLPDFAKNVRVKMAGKDVSLAEVVRQKSSDPQQATYRDLRTANGGTADGQRELAHWCRKQRLAEEERLHWRILLSMRPGDPEAIKALRLKNYLGMLLTSDEIDKVKQNSKRAEEAAKNWMPKLKKLKRSIEHGDAEERTTALRELKSIQDPLAIPSLEEVFGVETGVGLEVVEVLAKMPADEAAVPLARISVESSDPYVRQKAGEALQSRPYETYVPVLVAHLATPIEMSVNVAVDPGWQKWKEVEWTEFTGEVVVGLYNKFRLRSAYTNKDVFMWTLGTRRKSGYMMTENVPDRLRYNYLLTRDSPNPDSPYEYSGTIEDNPSAKKSRKGESIENVEERVRKANAEQAALNDKIHAALNAATGAHLPPEKPNVGPFDEVKPKAWWDWWKQQSHTSRYFAAGTAVWTQCGLVPIEQILVGDRLLTRQPSSGELTFQLVLATRSQAKSGVRVLNMDRHTIVATPDQQFFVSGKGWRRMSNLEPETKLDSLAGPQPIKKITDGDGAMECGIVVSNVPNFFVGVQGILAHDATNSNVK
jgi:hypothetical protein